MVYLDQWCTEAECYSVAPAISSSYSRAGVVINFVTATGGDVEMLRSIECFYKLVMPGLHGDN
jgi:translation initiation factor 4A